MRNLHLEKFGAVGTVITIACCLGFAPLLALLSAIGASFLINDALLTPLLVGFLLLGGFGLFLSMRRHRRRWPFAVHVISAAALMIFTFVIYVQALVWLGVVGLIAASVSDFFLKRACESESGCDSDESSQKTCD